MPASLQPAAATFDGFEMTEPILIKLAGKPIPNSRRTGVDRKSGRVWSYRSKKTDNYHAAIQVQAQDSMNGRPPLEGPVLIEILVRLPVPKSWSKKKKQHAFMGSVMPTKRPDIDNFQKVVFDALSTVVFRDDSQITDCKFAKRYSESPALIIRVTPLQAEAA